MNEAPTGTFHEAIQATHGAKATLAGRERVQQQHEGETVLIREVLILDLEGHPTVARAYAWEADWEVTAVMSEGGT